MRWDVFCRVIDNFGDIGVCWRLCAELAGRGHAVRLWVDDARALAWMAPEGERPTSIEVRHWDHPPLAPGDVVVEAFGCNPPDAFVAGMHRTRPPVWINLEYLSAEAWVERCHGLRSPVLSGPGEGLSKWFFYPGFTGRTGGLLRGAAADRAARWPQGPDAQDTDGTPRDAWLCRHGIALPDAGERLLSLFCYEPAPVDALLDGLALSGRSWRVLVTPGHATQLTRAWQARRQGAPGPLKLHELPALPQTAFDALLKACDLNFVRGEDSAVQALWAERPHIWHIYPQDDGVHAGKLDAFMALWMADWPGDLTAQVTQLWRAWNGLTPASPTPEDFSAFGRLLDDPRWLECSRRSSRSLAEIPDLATQLCGFVVDRR